MIFNFKMILEILNSSLNIINSIQTMVKKDDINKKLINNIEDCYRDLINELIKFCSSYIKYLNELNNIEPESDNLKKDFIITNRDSYICLPGDIKEEPDINKIDTKLVNNYISWINGINEEKEISNKLSNSKEFKTVIQKYDDIFIQEYDEFLIKKNMFIGSLEKYKRISSFNKNKINKLSDQLSTLYDLFDGVYNERFNYWIRVSDFETFKNTLINIMMNLDI